MSFAQTALMNKISFLKAYQLAKGVFDNSYN